MDVDLEQWLAEEREVRERVARAGFGLASPTQARSSAGLDLLRSMLAGEVPAPPIAHTLDYMLLHVDKGHAIFQGTPAVAHLNPMGTVHGGWITTLLDSAMGCAVHTTMDPGRSYTTTDLSVRFVRALFPKVQRVRAEGRIVHAGRQIATSEARLYGSDGKLYATSTCTCLCFDLPG